MPPDLTQFGVAGIFVAGFLWAARIVAPALINAATMISNSMASSTRDLKEALMASDQRHGADLDKMLSYFTDEQKADAEARHRQANAIMMMAIALEKAGIHVDKASMLGITKNPNPDNPVAQT